MYVVDRKAVSNALDVIIQTGLLIDSVRVFALATVFDNYSRYGVQFYLLSIFTISSDKLIAGTI